MGYNFVNRNTTSRFRAVLFSGDTSLLLKTLLLPTEDFLREFKQLFDNDWISKWGQVRSYVRIQK